MAIAGRVAIVPKGYWSANATYKRLDAVTYNNALFIAKKEVSVGILPTNIEYWMKSIDGSQTIPNATKTQDGLMSKEDKTKIDDFKQYKPDGKTITADEDGTLHGVAKVTVDTTLSSTSTNPVQNKVVKGAVDELKQGLGIESARIEELNQNLGVERARIDSLTKLPEGSTTGDAELQDIRVKADGTTATSAGNAVREQISELKGDLGDLHSEKTEQLLDFQNATILKSFINSSTKQIVSNSGCESVIVKIDTSKGTRISVHKELLSVFVIGFFTEENPDNGSTAINVTSNDNTKLLTFDVPTNTKSIVIWYYFNTKNTDLNPNDILKGIMVKYGYYSRFEPYGGVSGYNQIPRYYDVADEDFNSISYLLNSSTFVNGDNLLNAPKGVTSGSFFLKNTIITDDDTNRIVLQTAYARRIYSNKVFKRYIVYNKTTNNFTTLANWEEVGDKPVFNKMCVAGDSITAGYPSYVDGDHWWEAVERMLRFDVNAIAQTGAGISYWRGTNACKIAKDTDFSNYDVCVFAFGTNDFGNNIPIGSITDTYIYSEDSSQTFYASLKYVVETVKNKKKDITIIFSLPLNRKAFVDAQGSVINLGTRETKWCYGNQNLIGKTLLDYCDAIINVCDKYGIPYIDHRNGAFDVFSIDTLLIDGLHPTEKGYKILGEEMSARIGAILKPYVGYDGF